MARHADFEGAISFAQDLIRIPSLPGAEGELAARVKAEMEALRYDDVWTDGAGNVIGRVRGAGREPSLMLSSHLDAVDVGDPDGWEHAPYAGDVTDGTLHGRGAMDIKGPLAIQTYAAARLLHERPASDVFVAHTVLEERGGMGMEYLLDHGEVRPAAVVLGEATHGDICIGHRGRAELIIEIHGVAAHASAPERACNPLSRLPAVLEAIERFGAELGSDPVLGRATIAATAVETPHSSRNVIPDRVRIVVDWRVLPALSAREAEDTLQRAVDAAIPDAGPEHVEVRFATESQAAYTGHTRERSLFTPGFLLSPDHPVVRAAANAIEAATRTAPAVRPWTFATDGGHTCGTRGIPTIGYAPGEERFAHTNRERLDLFEAETVFDVYPSVITAVLAASVS